MSTLGRPFRLALVEYLDEADVAADLVVAMSPMALQQCLDRRIDASVVDDHIRRLDLIKDQLEYLRWQASWISRLDDMAELGGAARTAALAFKGPVDAAVLTSRILRQLFTVLAPSHVIYVDRLRTEPTDEIAPGGLYLWGHDSEPRPAGRLIEAVCAELGIVLERISLPTSLHSDRVPPVSTRLRRALGPRIGPRRSLRPRRPLRSRGPAVVMTWYGGYGATSFLRSQLQDGSRVLYLVRGRSFTRLVQPALSWWRSRSPRIPLDGYEPRTLPAGVHALMGEVDHWSGTPGTGTIVASRLEHVLCTMCPAIEGTASALVRAFRQAGVARVACANPSSAEEFAALLAAQRAGVRRQLIQHGDHLMGYEAWVGYDVPNFDEWVCSDPTVPADVRRICDAVGVRPPQFTFTPYRRRDMRRSTADHNDSDGVCYVPTFFQAGSALFGPTLDDAWYYRWQCRLVAWMAARTDRTFVWKAFPPANHAEDPIPALLEREGITNIRFETRPLAAALGSVSRVILDFASTALFEVVQAGVPTLAISFPSFMPLRPAAAKVFQPILRECTNEDDAIQEIERFVGDDRERWILDRRRLGSDPASRLEAPGETRPASA